MSAETAQDEGYFRAGGWKYELDPPRVGIDNRGMVEVWPFGMCGGVDISFNVTVDRWRRIVADAERAISEHIATSTVNAEGAS